MKYLTRYQDVCSFVYEVQNITCGSPELHRLETDDSSWSVWWTEEASQLELLTLVLSFYRTDVYVYIFLCSLLESGHCCILLYLYCSCTVFKFLFAVVVALSHTNLFLSIANQWDYILFYIFYFSFHKKSTLKFGKTIKETHKKHIGKPEFTPVPFCPTGPYFGNCTVLIGAKQIIFWSCLICAMNHT